jgi:hypothetical protein
MSDPEHLARLKKGPTVETPTLPNLRLTLIQFGHDPECVGASDGSDRRVLSQPGHSSGERKCDFHAHVRRILHSHYGHKPGNGDWNIGKPYGHDEHCVDG